MLNITIIEQIVTILITLLLIESLLYESHRYVLSHWEDSCYKTK